MMTTRLVWLLLTLWSPSLWSQSVCEEPEQFHQSGWQLKPVQAAMDQYLRDHRMRANWLNQPAPPDQIGRDYYQWLWHSDFGAAMKRQVIEQFCGTSQTNGP